MPYCTSCGSYIPEDQGSSCSMCYGDIAYGSDGYYSAWAEEQEQRREYERELANKQFEEQLEALKFSETNSAQEVIIPKF